LNFPRNPRFWSVGLGHMINDTFISMGPVVLAFLSVSILPMTNTQIGLAVSATQLVGAVTQPGFGLLADRTGGRWLGAGGVAWTVGFFLLALVTAQTGYFWLMFIPFILRAAGSGAFHPVGALHAAESDSTRVASNMAYFFLMGQMGLALGPLLAGILLDMANPSTAVAFGAPFTGVDVSLYLISAQTFPLFLVAFIALPIVWYMTFILPTQTSFREQHPQKVKTAAKLRLGDLPLKAFGVLGLLVALRSLAQPGSVAFVPVLFQEKGWSPSEYGAITSLFWVGSGIAGVMFGNLADRVDRRYVVAGSLLCAAPTFFLLPIMDGGLALILALLAGGLSGGSHSIIVVLAQELIPAAKGFASGAILGFIFGMGAVGSLLIGTLSDSIGLGTTFQLVAVVLVVTSGLALLLPGSSPAAVEETITPSPAEAPEAV